MRSSPQPDTFPPSREDLYVFPYTFHVTVTAYATFAEAVVGATLLTMVLWNGLPERRAARLLILAILTAAVEGVVGYTLLYSPFTAQSVAVGALSWSQFLLEFLALGTFVGIAWDAFGRHRPSGAVAETNPKHEEADHELR